MSIYKSVKNIDKPRKDKTILRTMLECIRFECDTLRQRAVYVYHVDLPILWSGKL
jgi:hypothetical protein